MRYDYIYKKNKMKNKFNLFALTIAAFCLSCSSNDDSSSGDGDDGGIVIQASYKVTFEPNFTTQFHPNDYPDDASFDGVFLMAHSEETSLFSLGSLASPGLKIYAEEGNTATLSTEHAGGEDTVNPTTVVITNDDIGPTETKTFTINVTPNTTFLSFVTRISPSPDWFLGLNSFNLATSDNTLIESESFELYAIDAGTDAGASYTSDNDPESQIIVVRTGLPLSNNVNETGKNLGILKIERINTN